MHVCVGLGGAGQRTDRGVLQNAAIKQRVEELNAPPGSATKENNPGGEVSSLEVRMRHSQA